MDHLQAGPYFGLEWENVPDTQCQTGGLGEFMTATNWLVLQLGGGGAKHVHTKRVVEFRDGWPPGWPLLWVRVEDCARCAVPVGGLRRISERDELASAAVGGAKHVHAKRVRISRWLTSCLALTGPYFGLV
jgi:hypothetical protein